MFGLKILMVAAFALISTGDWGWCLAVVAAANVSKFAAAYWAARLSRFNHAESAMIGYMMNTRALMELIVINVGLDLGVISPAVFTMLVIMAIFSTVITTPALKYYLARGGIDRRALRLPRRDTPARAPRRRRREPRRSGAPRSTALLQEPPRRRKMSRNPPWPMYTAG